MEVLVGGRYKLCKKLGSGAFGDVYKGKHVVTGEEFAVKLEPIAAKHPQLLYEAKLYKFLAGSCGIPRVHWYGVEGKYNILVLDLLGPSLEDLFTRCGRRFSLKTVLMLGDQMISRLELLHSRNFIHRDVKPDNFLMGIGGRTNQVFAIDFGLAKKYRSSTSGLHIPYREGKSLIGTARYASVTTHLGIEQSRRDDLEAVGFVLLYFARGSLPWQGLDARTKEEKYQAILEKKVTTTSSALCRHLPREFAAYLDYCRNLCFDGRPDYAYLRNILKAAFLREGNQYDGSWDWTTPLSSPSLAVADVWSKEASSPAFATGAPTITAATADGRTTQRDSAQRESGRSKGSPSVLVQAC